MTQENTKSQLSKKQSRQDRLSKALRQNLLKRKQQQRNREDENSEPPQHTIDVKNG